jgi:hypothetical protein
VKTFLLVIVLLDTQFDAQLGLHGAFGSRAACEAELAANERIFDAIRGPKSPWVMAFMECREISRQLQRRIEHG